MNRYNDELLRLQQQTARRHQLEAVREDLYEQCDALRQKADSLESLKLREQADVDRLEGRSLASFFYNVIGKMDEKLDKEREEAYQAAVRFDAASKELAAAEADLQRCQDELRGLADCEERYRQMLREKNEAVKASGSAAAGEILAAEQRIAELDHLKRELHEAVGAGRSALRCADGILSSLGSAKDWSTWDLLGGDFITDMVKHGHLDDAQREVEALQVQLRRFKSELADVTIHADLQVTVDGFLRFADWFFDDIFSDWAVHDRIKQSIQQVHETQAQVQSVIDTLASMLNAADSEQAQLRARLDDLVLRA